MEGKISKRYTMEEIIDLTELWLVTGDLRSSIPKKIQKLATGAPIGLNLSLTRLLND